jgi:seryl-tRNA synthetase
MINNCPICDTPYQAGQSQCKTCHWYLDLDSQNRGMGGTLKSVFNDHDNLAKIESWGKTTWQRLNRYKRERNRNAQEAQRWREDIIVELSQKVENLRVHWQNLANIQDEITRLKQELISDLDNRIYSIVQQSLDNFDFGKRLGQSLPRGNKLSDLSMLSNLPEQVLAMEEENVIDFYPELNQQVSLEKQHNLAPEITPEERSLIQIYYNDPQYLTDYIDKVAPTKQTLEDIYLNKADEVIFQSSNQSDYWIIKLQSGTYYLLPDLNLKINTNIKTVRIVFSLQDYQEYESKKFTLIKPAKVLVTNNSEWKLSEKGILQF